MAARKPIVLDGVDFEQLDPADTLDVDAALVVNESGVDVDTRIEGESATQLFVVDAGANSVRIGTTTVGALADFGPASAILNSGMASGYVFDVQGNGGSNRRVLRVDADNYIVGVSDAAGIVNGVASFGDAAGTVLNDGGADRDTRIEGESATHLFVVDAGLDAVQLGTTGAGDIMDARSAGVVFNETGVDKDFRVEGESLTHLLFAQGDGTLENIALLANGAPDFQDMNRGAFIGNLGSNPSDNPSGGVFVFSEGGVLKNLNANGHQAAVVRPPDVQVFTTNGANTWTKPTGAVTVARYLIGAGGGGGGGRRGGAASIRGGGGGGGGGGYSFDQNPASEFNGTETVTIGAGETAGARANVSDTGDATFGAGGAGGNTTMTAAGSGGVTLTAGGGGAGSGGSSTTGGAGGAGGSTSGGAAGGAGGRGGGAGNGATGGTVTGQMAGAGGGGGWGVTAAPANDQGGFGGNSGGLGGPWGFFLDQGGNGFDGHTGSAFISNGVPRAFGGGGGGGGAPSMATTGFTVLNGGRGNRYGAGGGGGGGGTNGADTFNGGQAGVSGIAIIVTYFDPDITPGSASL